MTLQIGLTGNIGSGKTTVADLLEAHGAVVIQADKLAFTAPAITAKVGEGGYLYQCIHAHYIYCRVQTFGYNIIKIGH